MQRLDHAGRGGDGIALRRRHRFAIFALTVTLLGPGCRGNPAEAVDASDSVDAADAVDVDSTECAPVSLKVDGDFSTDKLDPDSTLPPCKEYKASLKGMFGTLHLASGKSGAMGRLQLLNDWHLRSNVPICSAMYNLFQFTTGGGKEAWEVRVYGGKKGRIDVRLNGVPYKGEAEAMSSFGPSEERSDPHTKFEFAVVGPTFGNLAIFAEDPKSGPSGWQPGGEPSDCGSPHLANVAEPTIYVAEVGPDGITGMKAAKGPLLVWVDPPAIVAGESVLLRGQKFGTGGDVIATMADGTETKWPTETWADGTIALRPPAMPFGSVVSLAVHPISSALRTNALPLRWQPPGPPEDCTTAPPGAPCDDGNPATIGDHCTVSSTCAGVLPLCEQGDPCVVAVVDPTTGLCTSVPVDDAAKKPCKDDNPCTDADRCVGGVCKGDLLPASSCDDSDDCTVDSCDPTVGCVHAPLASGCDDDNPCTQDECAGSEGCKHIALEVGTACNADDNPCTVGDSCYGGYCKPGALDDCGGGVCNMKVCDPNAGGCIVKDGPVFCDDGDACTTDDFCKDQNDCQGTTVDCDDGKPCTIDSCDKTAGCQHTASTAPECQ